MLTPGTSTQWEAELLGFQENVSTYPELGLCFPGFKTARGRNSADFPIRSLQGLRSTQPDPLTGVPVESS